MPNYHHFTTIATPDGPMPTYICAPEGGEPRPAVLVIQGMHGLNSTELKFAEHLADAGYVAAAPDLFHRGPACFSPEQLSRRRRALNDPQVMGDVNATFGYLQAQSYVRTDCPMGILGFCMGGRVSYLVAGSLPNIGMAAVFYGGGIHAGEGGPAPIDLTPNIRCPVLVFDGEQDEHPSPEENRKTAAALARHAIVHELHLYPGVGHGFMGRPSTAATEAWAVTIDWLHRYLPVPQLAEARLTEAR